MSRLGREAQPPGGLERAQVEGADLKRASYSIVTAMRSSATAVATMRAPFGSIAVTSAGAARFHRSGKSDSR